MAFESTAGFGLRTLLFKLATVAGARSGNIFIVLTLFKKLASFQGMAGRTSKGISISIGVKRSGSDLKY